MEVENFEIHFQKNAIYAPGDDITGIVSFNIRTQEPPEIRGVYMNFAGKAVIVVKTYNYSHEICFSQAEEKYFEEEIVLCGKGRQGNRKQGDNVFLDIGENKFPFTFTLPQHIPPSFESFSYFDPEYHIRYIATCIIASSSSTSDDVKVENCFTVYRIVDLNTFSDCLEPQAMEKTTATGWPCCPSGSICIEFCVDRNGYAPGEAIQLSIDLYNQSNELITKTIVSLERNATLTCNSKKISHSTTIAEKKYGSVEPFTEDHWKKERFCIPLCSPSVLEDCNIIDLSYNIVCRVYSSITGEEYPCQVVLECQIPVIIGNVLHRFLIPYGESYQRLDSYLENGNIKDTTLGEISSVKTIPQNQSFCLMKEENFEAPVIAQPNKMLIAPIGKFKECSPDEKTFIPKGRTVYKPFHVYFEFDN